MPSTNHMRATLVLPTYNERESLLPLVAALQALPASLHIVVVDDNSPDGTGLLADQLAAAQPHLEVIHRPAKQGLGTANATGFRIGKVPDRLHGSAARKVQDLPWGDSEGGPDGPTAGLAEAWAISRGSPESAIGSGNKEQGG